MKRASLLVMFAVLLFSCARDKITNGYCDKMSYEVGDTMRVFLNTEEQQDDYSMSLFDLKGEKRWTLNVNVFSQDTVGAEPWANGFGYKPTMKFVIPSSLESGVYLWDKKIPFVVKDQNAEIVIVYSSNTENAYGNAGGKSLYSYNSSGMAPSAKVSFLRPIKVPYHSIDFLKWFKTLDYKKVGYVADIDLDNYDNIKNAKLLLIIGHSEYWTRPARQNFDRFVDEGHDALILSGNTMWWQVRYSDDYNEMICYKSIEDPIPDTLLKSVNWDFPQLKFPILNSIGVEFSKGGMGKFEDKGWNGYKIVNEKSVLLEGTNLRNGDILAFESDENDAAIVKAVGKSVVADNDKMLFKNIELIGYDSVAYEGREGLATWVVLKKSENSGVIVNTASTNWCKERGIRSHDLKLIHTITINMIDKLLKKENVFSMQ
jgi:hypothetical protein